MNSLVNVSGKDDGVQCQYHAPRSVRHKMVYVLFQEGQQILVWLEVIQHQLPRKKLILYIHDILKSLASLYNIIMFLHECSI